MSDLVALDFQLPATGPQFVESLRATGFGVLKNHPLDLTLIRSIYEHWAAFYASDRPDAYTVNRDTQDGFFSMGDAESAKGQVEQDIKEYFHFYPWGQCPEDLRDELMTYYQAAHDLAAILLSWIERYSPPDMHFSEPLSTMITGSEVTLLRILHYPPLKGNEQAHAERAAAHEDINLLTILPMSSAAGLEVLGSEGQWIPVPADLEYVVVNTGDMLQETSNGYFPSTTHRVVNPVDADENVSRMSLPLFLHPRPDVVLSARHTAGSYLDERLRELGVV